MSAVFFYTLLVNVRKVKQSPNKKERISFNFFAVAVLPQIYIG